MITGTMSHVQTLTAADDLRRSLSTTTVEDVLANSIPSKYLKPNFSAIDGDLAKIEQFAVMLGRIKTLSDQDRENLRATATEAFEFVKRIDRSIEILNSLSDDVEWKQKAHAKMVHLANQTEDLAETCALAADKEFTETIKAQIQRTLNASADG